MSEKHPLESWLEGRMSQAKFAEGVGCSEPHLSLVLQRKRGVSLKMALRLSAATNGEIPVDRFLIGEAAQ